METCSWQRQSMEFCPPIRHSKGVAGVNKIKFQTVNIIGYVGDEKFALGGRCHFADHASSRISPDECRAENLAVTQAEMPLSELTGTSCLILGSCGESAVGNRFIEIGV